MVLSGAMDIVVVLLLPPLYVASLGPAQRFAWITNNQGWKGCITVYCAPTEAIIGHRFWIDRIYFRYIDGWTADVRPVQ